MKAWISYSHKDQPFAKRLKKSLEEADLGIQFYDASTLNAGVDWSKEIYEDITESDIIFFILSKESVKSEWISTEIGIAIAEIRKSDKKRIIPIIIDKNVALPAFIDQFHYLDLSNKEKYHEQIDRLISGLKHPQDHSTQEKAKNSDRIKIELNKQREIALETDKLLLEQKKSTYNRVISTTVIISLISVVLTLVSFFIGYEKILNQTLDITTAAILRIVLVAVISFISGFTFNKIWKRNAK